MGFTRKQTITTTTTTISDDDASTDDNTSQIISQSDAESVVKTEEVSTTTEKVVEVSVTKNPRRLSFLNRRLGLKRTNNADEKSDADTTSVVAGEEVKSEITKSSLQGLLGRRRINSAVVKSSAKITSDTNTASNVDSTVSVGEITEEIETATEDVVAETEPTISPRRLIGNRVGGVGRITNEARLNINANGNQRRGSLESSRTNEANKVTTVTVTEMVTEEKNSAAEDSANITSEPSAEITTKKKSSLLNRLLEASKEVVVDTNAETHSTTVTSIKLEAGTEIAMEPETVTVPKAEEIVPTVTEAEKELKGLAALINRRRKIALKPNKPSETVESSTTSKAETLEGNSQSNKEGIIEAKITLTSNQGSSESTNSKTSVVDQKEGISTGTVEVVATKTTLLGSRRNPVTKTTTELPETTKPVLSIGDRFKLKRLPVIKTTSSEPIETTTISLAEDNESVTEVIEPEISMELESTTIFSTEVDEVTEIIDTKINESNDFGLKL